MRIPYIPPFWRERDMIVQYSSSQIVYPNITILVTMWLTLIHKTRQTKINPPQKRYYPCAYAWLIFNNKRGSLLICHQISLQRLQQGFSIRYFEVWRNFLHIQHLDVSVLNESRIPATKMCTLQICGRQVLWSKPFEHSKTNAGWCNFIFKPLCCSHFTKTKNNT